MKEIDQVHGKNLYLRYSIIRIGYRSKEDQKRSYKCFLK